MKGLWIKDISLMKNMMRVMLAIIIFSVVFSVMGENMFFSMGYISVFVAIFSISTISYDEYDNGFAYLFSLPFERKQYVQEKYLFGLGMIFIGLFISGGIALVVSKLTSQLVTVEEWIVVFVASVSVAVFMTSLVLPAHIKYGSEKGRVAMIVIFLAIGLVGGIIYGITEMTGIDLEKVLDTYFNSPAKIMTTAGGFSIVIMAVSYLVSVRIIEKKEF